MVAACAGIVDITALAFQQPAVAEQSVEERVQALTERVAQLEARLRSLEWQNQRSNLTALTENRKRFTERTRLDSTWYTAKEMEDIEALYQAGHYHDGQSANRDMPSAIENHKRLIAKYPRANRAGCALLDLAGWVKPPESDEYLKRAIAEYSDSYFGNGVSVGAYGRYRLAYQYKRDHKDGEAAVLVDEIRKNYPDAVADDGGPLESYLGAMFPRK
jgi:TolA-binding protein